MITNRSYISKATPNVGSYRFFTYSISWFLSLICSETPVTVSSISRGWREGSSHVDSCTPHSTTPWFARCSYSLLQYPLLLLVINPLAPLIPPPSNSIVTSSGPSWWPLKSCISNPSIQSFLLCKVYMRYTNANDDHALGPLQVDSQKRTLPHLPWSSTVVNSIGFGGWVTDPGQAS